MIREKTPKKTVSWKGKKKSSQKDDCTYNQTNTHRQVSILHVPVVIKSEEQKRKSGKNVFLTVVGKVDSISFGL